MAAGAGSDSSTKLRKVNHHPNKGSTHTHILAPTEEAFEPLMVVAEEEIFPHLGKDVEACISRIPSNVDFDKMKPRTNDFNLQGIMKSITETP